MPSNGPGPRPTWNWSGLVTIVIFSVAAWGSTSLAFLFIFHTARSAGLTSTLSGSSHPNILLFRGSLPSTTTSSVFAASSVTSPQ